MESINDFVLNYDQNKAKALSGRYITNHAILPLLKVLPNAFKYEVIGHSEQNRPIYSVKIGTGKIKILIWSQMHGNESTCTKALFDIFNVLKTTSFDTILRECSLFIIPILNPDGAESYTRKNANQVDINRDAVDLSQSESKVLRAVFDAINPDYGFNMHDQRTLFNVGKNNAPATVSFLSPAQDQALTLTPNRLRAMSVIHQMNLVLQKHIPGQIGRFDDAFNINCVGDNFQAQGTSTILFEAGHFHKDYNREESRKFIAFATLQALLCISANSVNENDYENYLQIPENNTLFFDVLIKNALIFKDNEESVNDIGIIFEEILNNGEILFLPKIKSIGNLSSYFGHKTINADKKLVQEVSGISIESDADFCNIVIGNSEISLLLNNNLT
jgi:hypothetical protein